MYKMIVVDDEDWVRERLIHTLDWECRGIEVVDEAGCGMEALEKAKLAQPDIILTDIRMPNMDGLELIKRLKENKLDAKTIIISGYSDFDYAQKAITLGAYDYILKPVEDDDLFATVERCLEQIRSDKTRTALLEKANQQVNKRMPLLKEMFFSNLIHNQVQNEQNIIEALADFGIVNENLNHICFIIHVYDNKTMGREKGTDGDFVQFVIRNVAKDIVDQISVNEILFTNSGEVVGVASSVLPEGDLTRKVSTISDEIKKVVNRILNGSVTIGIGGTCGNLADIHLSYRQAKQSSLANGYLSKANPDGIPASATFKTDAYRGYDIDPLVNSILTGNKQAALAGLNRIMDENSSLQPVELKFIYINMVNSIVKTSLSGKKVVEDFSNYCLHFLEIVNKAQKVGEIHLLLADAVEKMIDYLEKTQTRRKRKAIEKSIAYMEENYSHPISLNTVSEMLFLNASYLSKIFKEEMGLPFSKYLMELRVAKAIELMNDTTLKIYEIASRVGYEDVQYFTKMFRSIKGVTPMQYREKIN